MKLRFVPMVVRNEFVEEVYSELYDDLIHYFSSDETLGNIFDSYEIMNPVYIPPLEELEKTRSFYQPSYGDRIRGAYTTKYMQETASNWKNISGRVIALTDAKLITPKLFFEAFSTISGVTITDETVIVSAAYFRYDPFKIYKDSKELLGYTFDLSTCTNDCIMNVKKDFSERSIHYCPKCKNKLSFEE